MAEQKRHDSLAPKGAFVGKGASDSDLASAQTAALIAGSEAALIARPEAARDDDPEITIAAFDEPFPVDEDLCADELLAARPSTETDRVSVEDAMRALIDLRLERSRPSDQFGTFDVAENRPPRAASAATGPNGDPRQLNSLAPIELAPAPPSRLAAQPTRKRNPFPILAAAALALLAVGIYRRADRQSTTDVTQAAAPTAAMTTEIAVAEPVAADMQVLEVSESEDAILTLGTPTILNVPATDDETNPSAGPSVRAEKEPVAKPKTVARVSPETHEPEARKVESTTSTATALPESPSRDAIVTGFNSVRDQVVACANGGGGVAPIEATIMKDGRITHATVGGYYQGTPEGSCIARALRTARFAPFGRESIKVTFPYTL